MSDPGATRFPGLDSLRFWAATLVVVGHVPMNQAAAMQAPSNAPT